MNENVDEEQPEGDVGSLVTPTLVTTLAYEESQLREQWDTFDSVELELTKRGFSPIEQPKIIKPVITPDIIRTVDQNLYSDIYNALRAWYEYASNTLARIQSVMLSIKNEKKEYERVAKKSIIKDAIARGATKRPSKEVLKEMVEDTPRYRDLSIEEQKYEQQEILMTSYAKSLFSDMSFISRNVEIRKQDYFAGRSQADQPKYPHGWGRQ